MTVHQRRQPGLQAARLQAGLHVLQTLGLEPLLLVVLAGEGLDDADRGQHLFDDWRAARLLSCERRATPLLMRRVKQ